MNRIALLIIHFILLCESNSTKCSNLLLDTISKDAELKQILKSTPMAIADPKFCKEIWRSKEICCNHDMLGKHFDKILLETKKSFQDILGVAKTFVSKFGFNSRNIKELLLNIDEEIKKRDKIVADKQAKAKINEIRGVERMKIYRETLTVLESMLNLKRFNNLKSLFLTRVMKCYRKTMQYRTGVWCKFCILDDSSYFQNIAEKPLIYINELFCEQVVEDCAYTWSFALKLNTSFKALHSLLKGLSSPLNDASWIEVELYGYEDKYMMKSLSLIKTLDTIGDAQQRSDSILLTNRDDIIEACNNFLQLGRLNIYVEGMLPEVFKSEKEVLKRFNPSITDQESRLLQNDYKFNGNVLVASNGLIDDVDSYSGVVVDESGFAIGQINNVQLPLTGVGTLLIINLLL